MNKERKKERKTESIVVEKGRNKFKQSIQWWRMKKEREKDVKKEKKTFSREMRKNRRRE